MQGDRDDDIHDGHERLLHLLKISAAMNEGSSGCDQCR